MTAMPTAADAWAATNIMTQMTTRLQRDDRYLGRDDRELGTRISPTDHELFTICPPAEALQLHFERHQPTFIAVHDIGGQASGGFMGEIAAALRLPLQRLTFRQQGSGAALAVLRFVELPAPRSASVRIYGTLAEGDAAQRRLIGETLLAFSRLGVLLVQAPSEPLIAAQFGLLRDRLLASPWANRDLLVVPCRPTAAIDAHARRLVEGSLIQASVAAPSPTTSAVWRAIHGTWSQLRNGAAPTAAPAARVDEAPATGIQIGSTRVGDTPVQLRPFGAPAPAARAAIRPAPEPTMDLAAYVRSCAELRGALACLAFDRTTHRRLALAASQVDPSGSIGRFAAMLDASLGLQAELGGHAGPEIVATLERHVLVLRVVPGRPDCGLALFFDKFQADLALLRVQLQKLDAQMAQ